MVVVVAVKKWINIGVVTYRIIVKKLVKNDG